MTLRLLIWCAVSTKVQAEDDKTSLPTQEASGRAFGDKHDMRIVDVLVVPGHRRSYIDFYEMANDARDAGIAAFYQLRDHWKARDFDVLWVRDGNRFAREQAPHSLIVSSVIDAGARIYTETNGWVDKSNYRMFISIDGYAAAAAIDHLKRAQFESKNRRISEGFPVTSSYVYSHKPIRDELGRMVAFIPDDSKRRLIEDAITILLEGVSWPYLEGQLYERFGHARNGEPFSRYYFYHLFNNPWFWGHGARNFKNSHSPRGQGIGLWCFDESEPVPEGVLMWRNTHEPFLDGELADKVKAELRRRILSIRGQARTGSTHRFTGLLACANCGYIMGHEPNNGSPAWRCSSQVRARDYGRGCPRKWQIGEKKVIAWFDGVLRQMIKQQLPEFFLAQDSNHAEDEVARLSEDIARVEKQAARLIAKQAEAPDALASLYDDQLNDLGQQLEVLRVRLVDAERETSRDERQVANQAFQELMALGSVELFWKQDTRVINQTLHRLMGRSKVRLWQGQVVSIE